jgi:hypothetical protein
MASHHLRRLREMLRGPAGARVSAKFGKIRSFQDTTALIAVLAACLAGGRRHAPPPPRADVRRRRSAPSRRLASPRRWRQDRGTGPERGRTRRCQGDRPSRRHADAPHAACNSWPPFFAEISGCIAEPPREHRESLRGKVVHRLSLFWRRVIVQLTMTASDRPRIQPWLAWRRSAALIHR